MTRTELCTVGVAGPALAPPAPGDGPAKDHRLVVNAILWRLATRAPWRDLPERYGP